MLDVHCCEDGAPPVFHHTGEIGAVGRHNGWPVNAVLANRMLGATGVSDSIDGFDRYGGACFDSDHMLCRYVMTESETLMMFFAGIYRPTKV
ncbi:MULTISPECIES: hypothetical protein [unclassified Halomonas]|uniref:hypothetical protein n=1 Tax=unclassified Halomonas TaxID=2609666 RepID=UPI000AEA802A|nr:MULTISPECIES: hypothetical protein [unclassified Halomonas]